MRSRNYVGSAQHVIVYLYLRCGMADYQLVTSCIARYA